MLILHITRDHAPAHCGGTSTAVTGLTDALSERGVEGRIVSFEQWRPRAKSSGGTLRKDEYNGLSVARLSTPDQLADASSWAKEQNADLILVHHEMLWEFAKDIADTLSVPCVLVVHVFQAAMNRVRGITERTMSFVAQERAFEEADAVVATSQAVRAELMQLYPTLEERLHLLGLGADRLAREPRRHFKRTVVFSGRFDSIKRLPLILAAMEKVVEELPDVRLILLGGNPGNPKVERRWYKRLEAEVSPKLQKQMDVMGWLTTDEVWEQLDKASIVITASLYETFGLSLLEAMARGLAAIVSPAGGLKELVHHGRNGLIVDSDEATVWAQALIQLLSDPERTLEMGEVSRALVSEGMLWSRVVTHWESLFVKLCGAHQSKL